jgi:hypothetical protein
MIDFMGYVNQTFKKIKGQLPERSFQSDIQNQGEDKHDSIVWDPSMRRYIINGKIPDDEDGGGGCGDGELEEE